MPSFDGTRVGCRPPPLAENRSVWLVNGAVVRDLYKTDYLDQLAKQMATYTTARSAAKLAKSPHVCRLLEVGCAADEETAVRRVAPHLIEKYKAYFSWGLEGLKLDPKATPEQQFRSLATNRFAVGSPAQVADMLVAQHRALGLAHAETVQRLVRDVAAHEREADVEHGGDLPQALPAEVVGMAFEDFEHNRGNGQVATLWELHPAIVNLLP